jgi:putative restriction endonuclease
MAGDDLDMQVRLAAFDHLAALVQAFGEVLPAKALWKGFEFRGKTVQFKGLQGIFKPALLPEMPLSITTAPPDAKRPAPYEDGFSADGSLLLYRYRGADPRHHENVGLRLAMERRRPLVYFHGVVKGEYFATWPVYVVGDEPALLRFRVAVDGAQYVSPGLTLVADASEEARRAYITVTTRQRLHQRFFRQRVLRAYQARCALCRLRHQQLLDAAHIVPDTDPLGEPVVPNGLALCKLHHAAFDQHFIGIRPDLVVQVRRDILDEEDGPMLLHGLQEFHERRILVPRRPEERPRADLLEERYQRFVTASQ